MPFNTLSRRAAMMTTPKMAHALLMAMALSAVCTSLVCTAATTADFTDAQRSSTLSFLRAFTDYSANLKAAWTGDDFCTWQGLNCTSASPASLYLTPETGAADLTRLPEIPDDVVGADVMVTQIQISLHPENALGTLPESWSRLSALKVLVVAGARITGTLPTSWSGMSSLMRIIFYNNQMTGTLPASWGSLVNLSGIQLNQNQFTGTIPNEWGNWQRLSFFVIDHNNLRGSIPEEFGEMPNLLQVNISSNHFCGCIPSSWVSKAGYIYDIDAVMNASDCATANSCTAEGSDDKGQARCGVLNCLACEVNNATSCVTCAQNYQLSKERQCTSHSDSAVRGTFTTGCHWMLVVVMIVASAIFYF